MKYLYLILVLTFINGCIRVENPTLTVNDAIRTDSIAAINRDILYFQGMGNNIKVFEAGIKSKIIPEDSAIKAFKPFTVIVKSYDSIIKQRTEEVNQNRRHYWTTNYNSTYKFNWAIILTIILLSGILGGLAAPKYKDLEDVINSVVAQAESISTKATDLVNNTPKTENLVSAQQSNLKDITFEINEFQDNIKILKEANKQPSKKDKSGLYILFGIIASAMAPLGLAAFDSKILDFKKETDFFLLAGFCLIAALFAKSWIKKIYEKVSSK